MAYLSNFMQHGRLRKYLLWLSKVYWSCAVNKPHDNPPFGGMSCERQIVERGIQPYGGVPFHMFFLQMYHRLTGGSPGGADSGEWWSREVYMHLHLEFRRVFMVFAAIQDWCTSTNGEGITILCKVMQIMEWKEPHAVGISARYIPGRKNTVADQLSCHFHIKTKE